MRLSNLTYKLYRASTGGSSFWHWEVLQKRRKAPLKSGYVYGTMADAKKRASAVMLDLTHAEKYGLSRKSNRRE
jgi:hypothetical protein